MRRWRVAVAVGGRALPLTVTHEQHVVRRRGSRVQWAMVAALVLAALVYGVGVFERWRGQRLLAPVSEAAALLSDRYVDGVTPEALRDAAIDGMVDSLDDPFTDFVPAVERAGFEEQLTGEYAGIGAEIEIRDGWLTIVSPIEGSPAWEAGLRPGDRVISVDGETTEGEAIEASIARMKGPPGTDVRVTIERTDAEGTRVLEETLERALVHQPAVKGLVPLPGGGWSYTLPVEGVEGVAGSVGGIGYIRVVQFQPGAAEEFLRALSAAKAQAGGELSGLVIDLRWNPGGSLQEVVTIADMLLRDGVIVSIEGGGLEAEVARARSRAETDAPIVVLINGASASASEILAGALTENTVPGGLARGVALGTRTYGKGSVQSIFELKSLPGALLKVTEQYYHLPSGRIIHRRPGESSWGVDPSAGFLVPMDEAGVLRQLERRRALDVLGRADEGSAEPVTLGSLSDAQLEAAVRAIVARVATGAWQPVSDALPGSSDLNELRRAERTRDRVLIELDRLDRTISALSAGVESASGSEDLWGDEVDLSGGVIEVLNAEGELVARLRVDRPGAGPGLERVLLAAGLTRAAAGDDGPGGGDGGGAGAVEGAGGS